MGSLARKIQRQIQRNNGTLDHKKVIARKLGCSIKELNKRMERKKQKEEDYNGKE